MRHGQGREVVGSKVGLTNRPLPMATVPSKSHRADALGNVAASAARNANPLIITRHPHATQQANDIASRSDHGSQSGDGDSHLVRIPLRIGPTVHGASISRARSPNDSGASRRQLQQGACHFTLPPCILLCRRNSDPRSHLHPQVSHPPPTLAGARAPAPPKACRSGSRPSAGPRTPR